jgi:hypothetical protein
MNYNAWTPSHGRFDIAPVSFHIAVLFSFCATVSLSLVLFHFHFHLIFLSFFFFKFPLSEWSLPLPLTLSTSPPALAALLYWPPLTTLIILISFPPLNLMVSTCIQRGFPEIHLNAALFLSSVYHKSHKVQKVIPSMALCGAAVHSSTQWRLILCSWMSVAFTACWLGQLPTVALCLSWQSAHNYRTVGWDFREFYVLGFPWTLSVHSKFG